MYSPDSPTYYPVFRNHKPDWLDIVLAKNVTITDIVAHNELSSDHFPVLSTVNLKSIYHEQIIKRKTDWHKYNKLISEKLGKISTPKTTNEIDEAVQKLTKSSPKL